MCGRAALTATPDELRDAFALDDLPSVVPTYNVPPSRALHAVRTQRSGSRRVATLDPLRWGLVPAWASNAKVGQRLALARVETVATAPAFRDALKHRRCLVAVSGFYEWQRRGSKHEARSQPFFIRAADGRVMALAGVWDRWVSPDGEVIESCAILTRPARPPVEAIHNRMPIVLPRDAWDRWLDADLTPPGALAQILESVAAPAAAAETLDLIAYPVGSFVNDPRRDGPACVEPANPPQQSMLWA